MPRLRLALAQVNAVVGDLVGNEQRVLDACRRAAREGADVVALPEMVLTGYPIEDLALRRSFQDAAAYRLEHLARQLRRIGLGRLVVVVGTLGRAANAVDEVGRPLGSPQNQAAVLHNGAVAGTYAKQHLPNYGVFDEFRYFVPGERSTILRLDGIDIALAVCEDIWRDLGPVRDARTADAQLLLVINGSPYEMNKDDFRLDLCSRRAIDAQCPLAYVNLTGGQDELVFEGDSMVVDTDGQLLARAGQFVEQVLIVDLNLADPPPEAGRSSGDQPTLDIITIDRAALPAESDAGADESADRADGIVLDFGTSGLSASATDNLGPRIQDEEEVYSALTTAIRDYVGKNGFDSVLLGLSGGIDSALTAALAADALGADRVFGVSMPSAHSSDHSRADAEDLAERIGMHFLTVPIAPMVDVFHDAITIDGLAAENLQARVRGMILMSLSNQEGHLVLTTGNKSELAVGYSTIYGDAVGGFAPLKDLPKTWVWRLSRWRNEVADSLGVVPPIPPSSIEKPPSAELRPDQLDTDSLPSYDILDDLLDDYIEQDASGQDLVDQGFDPALVDDVLRKVDRAEYKRRQYPPGPKISSRAFGRDRRLPITNLWRESVSDTQDVATQAQGAPG